MENVVWALMEENRHDEGRLHCQSDVLRWLEVSNRKRLQAIAGLGRAHPSL